MILQGKKWKNFILQLGINGRFSSVKKTKKAFSESILYNGTKYSKQKEINVPELFEFQIKFTTKERKKDLQIFAVENVIVSNFP